MKRMLKQLFVVLMSVMLIVGCSSNGGNEANGGNSGNEQGNASGGETKLSGDFEIQYFVGGYGDAWWKEVIAEFQKKYPDLNIKQSAGPKINDQMKPRWIQGNPPDVVYIDGAGSSAPQMVKDKHLMDITEWLKTAKNVDGELIVDQFITPGAEYDGKIYTLPLVFGTWGTWYDQALFEKNGWEVPKDYESFMAVNEKIKASGIAPYTHQGQHTVYILSGLLYSGFVAENGGDVAILEDINALKEGVFLSEPIQNTLDKIVEMRDKGYIDPGALALNHTEAQMQWLQHKNAFIPSGLWLENEMKKDAPEGVKYAFIPSVLQDKGEKYVAIPSTYSFAIAEKAKNPEAAKAFIQFMFTKQNAIRWAELTGGLLNFNVDLTNSGASSGVKSVMSYLNEGNTVLATTKSALDPDVNQEMKDATVALLSGQINQQQWGERLEAAAAKVRK